MKKVLEKMIKNCFGKCIAVVKKKKEVKLQQKPKEEK